MFEYYDILNDSLIMNCDPFRLSGDDCFKISFDPLHTIVDRCSNVTGYSWRVNETVSIPISVNTDIYVDDSSIISEVKGEYPDEYTEGYIGQKYYNIVDLVTYTMSGYDNDKFNWTKKDGIIYSMSGTKQITVSPDMSDKSIVVHIKDFRYEDVFCYTYKHVNECELVINKSHYDKLKQGLYVISIYIVSDDGNMVHYINEYYVHIK